MQIHLALRVMKHDQRYSMATRNCILYKLVTTREKIY
jgi:hypothetical protein